MFTCIRFNFMTNDTEGTNKNVVVNAVISCALYTGTLFIGQWIFLSLIYSIKYIITFRCKKQIVASE